jgi:hypothetical protein
MNYTTRFPKSWVIFLLVPAALWLSGEASFAEDTDNVSFPAPPPPPSDLDTTIAPVPPVITSPPSTTNNKSTRTEKKAALERKKAAAKARVERAKKSATHSTAAPYDENAEAAAPPSTASKKSKAKATTPPPDIAIGEDGTVTDPLYDPEEALNKVIEGNAAVDKVHNLNDRCCELSDTYQRDAGGATENAEHALAVRAKFEAKSSHDEGVLTEPSTGENTFGSRSTVCGTRPGNYDVCIFEGDVSPGRFRFTNKVVTAAAEGRSREWTFSFEGKNRQDISFDVLDSTDGKSRQVKDSHMMVFPRKYLPNIRIEGQKQIVTLPTGETVTYDVTTKEIIDGVLSEGPLGKGPGNVAYKGNGLLLRIDGNTEPRQGKGAMATISKGGKSCRIPAKSLWPDQSDSSALHFKFATDDAFNEFLKTKPGCPRLL